MRVFKTKEFARLSRRMGVDDAALCEGVARAERGLVDAVLGRFLIKQRIARRNEARSRGFRAVIVIRTGALAVFLHLFSKSDRANLTRDEEEVFRDAAKIIAGLGAAEIARLVRVGEWIEVRCGDDEDPS